MTQLPRIYSFLAALLACTASPSAWSAPSLWWDHFETGAANQAECVKQAGAILIAEKAGQVTSDADSVRAWSEKTVGVAECLMFGEKLIVSVLVSSEDAIAGSTLFDSLRSGMMKK
ncbi:MAG: hypothetical protein PHE55_07605 [Methylococcaceae bacterium]|nr:hypothetical protein [Methylococcaceae bacterium]